MAGIAIPFIGWFIIMPLGQLLVFVLWIIGVINSATGKSNELPLIGKFAKKLDF